MERLNVDQSLSRKDRASEQVLVEVAARLFIGRDAARTRHDPGKDGGLRGLQIHPDPRDKDAEPLGDDLPFVDDRAIERVLRN